MVAKGAVESLEIFLPEFKGSALSFEYTSANRSTEEISRGPEVLEHLVYQ